MSPWNHAWTFANTADVRDEPRSEEIAQLLHGGGELKSHGVLVGPRRHRPATVGPQRLRVPRLLLFRFSRRLLCDPTSNDPVQFGHVVPKSAPHPVVVDAVVGVVDDDAHSLDLGPRELARPRDKILRELGRDVTDPPDSQVDGLLPDRIVTGTEATRGDHIDPDAEKVV